jgi:hypothetical protein
MKVTVTKSGGFAGETETGEVDTAALSADDATRVEDAFATLASLGGGEVGADLFQFRIDISNESGERTLTISDPGDFSGPGGSALLELVRSAGMQA